MTVPEPVPTTDPTNEVSPSYYADNASSTRTASLIPVLDGSGKKRGAWRHVIGLLLITLTVFLWTTSNFLASTIFADNTYSKPYFVTYINTSFFLVPLVPILALKAFRRPGELRQWRDDLHKKLRGKYVPVKEEDEGTEHYTDDPPRRGSMSNSQELLLQPARSATPDAELLLHSTSLPDLTIPEIAKLSMEFCFLWFLANYSVAACLGYTTVASSTILTSTSSVFTLLFGSIVGVEKFALRKLLAVLASLFGIVLISTIDFSGKSADDEHRGAFPEKTPREIVIGDVLAIFGAVLYGIYAVFLKVRIGDESRIDMPIFFGLVGAINVLLLWPGLLILHFTGVERFELPPSAWVTTIILCNSLASLISDLAWAYAVLLTSPIVVTVGLSMSIPLSLIGQIVLNSQTVGLMYWVGAGCVVLSFVFVSQGEPKDGVPSLEGASNEGSPPLVSATNGRDPAN